MIGGDEEKRQGVVLAKSPVAKRIGIVSGEPIFQARKKYPDLEVYPADHKLYKKYSDSLYRMFKSYTDKVVRYSIDECLLNMTTIVGKDSREETTKFAIEIKNRIRELYGFTVNIGISTNRLLSKMASDFEKPDKVHTLYPDEIEEKMWPLPISDLFMVGRNSEAKLRKIGINTIGDLANYDENILYKKFGKYGKTIYEYANGIDNGEISYTESKPKGIGNSRTVPKDINDLEEINTILLELTEEVTYRLRKEKMLAKTVSVQMRTNDFQNYSHQCKLEKSTSNTKLIFEKVKELAKEMFKGTPVRLLGVRVDNLVDTEEMQISIFDQLNNKEETKQKELDNVLDGLKNKYGYDSIKRAREIKK